MKLVVVVEVGIWGEGGAILLAFVPFACTSHDK